MPFPKVNEPYNENNATLSTFRNTIFFLINIAQVCHSKITSLIIVKNKNKYFREAFTFIICDSKTEISKNTKIHFYYDILE